MVHLRDRVAFGVVVGVRIYLGRCQAFVSEQFLDGAYIGYAEQFCGEGVSEHVGVTFKA